MTVGQSLAFLVMLVAPRGGVRLHFDRESEMTPQLFSGRQHDHEQKKRNAIGARSSARQPLDSDQQVGQAA